MPKGFQPGHKRYGGTPKGYKSPKKQLRDLIEEKLGKTIPEELLSLTDRTTERDERRQVLVALMPYAYPKLQQIEMKADVETTVTNSEQVKELALEISGLKDEMKSYLKEE